MKNMFSAARAALAQVFKKEGSLSYDGTDYPITILSDVSGSEEEELAQTYERRVKVNANGKLNIVMNDSVSYEDESFTVIQVKFCAFSTEVTFER